MIVYHRVFGAPKKCWTGILSLSQNILRTKTKAWQCYINNENKNTIKDSSVSELILQEMYYRKQHILSGETESV